MLKLSNCHRFVYICMVLILMISSLVPLISISNTAYAKSLNNSGIIDSITSNKENVNSGETVKLTVNYSEKYNGQIQPGDTISISLPKSSNSSAGVKAWTTTKPLYDSQGVCLGTLKITNGLVTVTFNENCKDLNHIHGSFWFSASIYSATNKNKPGDSSTVTTDNSEWNIQGQLPHIVVNIPNHSEGIKPQPPLKPDVSKERFNKNGYMGSSGNVNWSIHGVTPEATSGEAILTDNCDPYQTIDWKTWRFQEISADGKKQSYNMEQFQTKFGSIQKTDHGFILKFNNISQLNHKVWNIYYRALVSDHSAKSYCNDASLTYHTKDKTRALNKNVQVDNINAGGSIDGDIAKGQITIHKYNEEGMPLANAQFTLTNELTNETKVADTNKDGKITFKNLTFGNKYIVRETKAPEGYDINPEIISISVNNSNGIPDVSINNKPTKPTKGLNIIDKKKTTSSSSKPTVTTSSSSKPTVTTSSSSKPTVITSSSSKPTVITSSSSKPTVTTSSNDKSDKNNKLPQTGNKKSATPLIGMLFLLLSILLINILYKKSK